MTGYLELLPLLHSLDRGNLQRDTTQQLVSITQHLVLLQQQQVDVVVRKEHVEGSLVGVTEARLLDTFARLRTYLDSLNQMSSTTTLVYPVMELGFHVGHCRGEDSSTPVVVTKSSLVASVMELMELEL